MGVLEIAHLVDFDPEAEIEGHARKEGISV
jgi:hypothetical protein